MRRAFTCLTLFVSGLLALAPTASAAPTVTLKVTVSSIPGFPGTGNILGAGIEAGAEYTIKGTEYGGFPSPLVLLTIDTPAGTKITPGGFATCTPSALEAYGPAACPKKSKAGPLGEGLGVVALGNEQVDEKVTIQPFFAPNDGMIFYVNGSTPVSLQIVEKAHWVKASGNFGPELIVEVPLVETVPGAADASILSFKVAIGAAYKKGKKTISYITAPKKCPKTGFLLESDLKFYSGESTTISYKQPCPRRR